MSEDHASYELLFCHELQSFVIFRVFFVLLGTSLLSFIDLFMDTCFFIFPALSLEGRFFFFISLRDARMWSVFMYHENPS